jgi:hypothetical protein
VRVFLPLENRLIAPENPGILAVRTPTSFGSASDHSGLFTAR